MARLWILHRDPRWRAALCRIAGDADALSADPADAGALAGAPPPRAILLGVAGDFEAELELAHRLAPRLADVQWVLLSAPRDQGEVRRLFDALPASLVALSSDAAELRRSLEAALAHRPRTALSERSRRDALARRFARWYGDLDRPELLAALDPARRELPLLVRGEPGSGRGLVARYLHWMGSAGAPGLFASGSASLVSDARQLLGGLERETGELAAADPATICIEDIDRAPPAVQRQLCAWIEHGPPAGTLPAARLRWIATAGPEQEERLDPDLARALAGVEIELPPLRERPGAVERIAAETAAEWSAARGERERRFAPDALARLRSHSWPGNLRELDGLVRRTLAASHADPIAAAELRFDRIAPLSPDLIAELEPDSPSGATPPRQADRLEYRPAPAEQARAASEASEVNRWSAQRAEGERSSSGRAAAQQEAQRGEGERSQQIRDSSAPTPDVRRLANAVAHEIGNPLVGIRSFAQMLPGRFDDPEFRRQFAERVDVDTRRIEAALDTLERLGSLGRPELAPVDVPALLAGLLELQRGRIQERRLVVLEELDREQPLALADAEQLRFAFGLLFDQALAWLPVRGDLYVATRHQAGARERLRILLRFRSAEPARPAGSGAPAGPEASLALADHALAVAVVESVVRAQGGTFGVEASSPGETLIVIELPSS